MRIFALDRSFYKLYRQDIAQLGPEASERLRLVQGFERLRRRGISGEEAAEILGPSRATIYRWKQRLERSGPRGLEPGRWCQHFSAACPVSRWTVADVCDRATSTTAARFLTKVLEQTPFPIEAVQVDGGSEFMALSKPLAKSTASPSMCCHPRAPSSTALSNACRRPGEVSSTRPMSYPPPSPSSNHSSNASRISTTPIDRIKTCNDKLPHAIFKN